MLAVPQHTTKQISKKQKRRSSYTNPKPFSDSSLAKEYQRSPFFKRISPFLLSAIAFPIFTIYALIADIHILSNTWLQLFVFTGIEVYLLFLDFALWNYFEGKKILLIWGIELSVLLAAIFFMV